MGEMRDEVKAVLATANVGNDFSLEMGSRRLMILLRVSGVEKVK